MSGQAHLDTMEDWISNHNGFYFYTPEDGSEECEIGKSCILMYFMFTGSIGMLIFIIGITGNVLSLLIVNRIERKSVTLSLRKSLAVVETLLLLIFVFQFCIISILDYFHYVAFTASVYLYFRVYFRFPMLLACLSISGLITCLLTFHR